MIHLIIGGARSGKSSFAQKQAEALEGNLAEAIEENPAEALGQNSAGVLTLKSKKQIIYIATATADDKEMAQRISHHQQNRPKHWLLIEEPLYLSDIIKANSSNKTILLIECMTLWLSNWLCHSGSIESKNKHWQDEKRAFIKALSTYESELIIVSNEVGSGIIPLGELSREFVDQAGWLNQELAKLADKVTLVVAGCPLLLK